MLTSQGYYAISPTDICPQLLDQPWLYRLLIKSIREPHKCLSARSVRQQYSSYGQGYGLSIDRISRGTPDQNFPALTNVGH